MYKSGVSDGIFWKLASDTSVRLQMKHRAPHNHTILEIVRVRWGVTAHVVFFFFAVCPGCFLV